MQVRSTPAARFVDHVLRGVGNVMLQNNPITGFLFLVGIFVNDWVSGVCAILGTAIATGTAMYFDAASDEVDAGGYGFNGALTGLGLAVYLPHGIPVALFVIVAAMFVSIVTAAIKHIAGPRGHAITGPFVLTTWIFVAALTAYTGLPHGGPAGPLEEPVLAASRVAALGSTDALVGTLNGVAQVMLQANPWTGAIFLVAIAVHSRISCLAAVLGSAVAGGVGWFMGAAPESLRQGLFGFNGTLTAIALGGVFFLLNRTTTLLAVLAVCMSAVLYGSLAVVFRPLGLPPLTAPFVVVTWICLLAGATLFRLAALVRVPAGTPEVNLRAARCVLAGKK